MLDDHPVNGLSPIVPGGTETTQEKTEEEMWAERGISFIPNSAGGGKIVNSSTITDPSEMNEYLDYLFNRSPYSDQFSGSISAAAYEWELHNKVYWATNMIIEISNVFRVKASAKVYQYNESAKDVDLGRTIFDDSHGIGSIIMQITYTFAHPLDALHDFFMR